MSLTGRGPRPSETPPSTFAMLAGVLTGTAAAGQLGFGTATGPRVALASVTALACLGLGAIGLQHVTPLTRALTAVVGLTGIGAAAVLGLTYLLT